MTRAVQLTVALMTLAICAPHSAEARPKRGAKRLAMAHFSVDSREVNVVASAKPVAKEGAVVVRLQHTDVPVCHLLIVNGSARKATKIMRAVRLPVCAAYRKEAKASRLSRVQLTNTRHAYRVQLLSKRMDAIAKGVEYRRFWGLYADMGTGMRAVFERTSTSFKSQVNKAINQAETCEAPAIVLGAKPTTLTIACNSESMLGGGLKKTRTTVRYHWSAGRFSLH
ncbi:MAG: hypothetical protein KC502_08625 [Myxococcales bacterium]|nr:hypothetical protein [Myxococcales bacterium]